MASQQQHPPPNAVAQRADGVVLVVPGEPGDLAALDGAANPVFYDGEGQELGTVEVAGVEENPHDCALFAIANLSPVRGATYLIAWYVTRHTSAKTFVVRQVNSERLQRLLRRLGMGLVDGGRDMAGSTRDVCRTAAQRCRDRNWRLLGPAADSSDPAV